MLELDKKSFAAQVAQVKSQRDTKVGNCFVVAKSHALLWIL
jgi:hypothetical protein